MTRTVPADVLVRDRTVHTSVLPSGEEYAV
jgi:hypothetical protein